MGIQIGQEHRVDFAINQTDLLAGTSYEIIAPVSGFIRDIYSTVQVAVGTGGVLKVAVGTTDVAGAAITVADAATKGTVQSAAATRTSTTRKVTKGDRIQVIPAAEFATAGALNGFITINTGE